MAALGDELKIVYIDGNINSGNSRAIRGRVVEVTERDITIERSDGRLTIGRNFVVKIEAWK